MDFRVDLTEIEGVKSGCLWLGRTGSRGMRKANTQVLICSFRGEVGGGVLLYSRVTLDKDNVL